jgi:hypothetical protein
MFRAKFHLSPIERITQIKRQGLLGQHARAGNHRVWLCDFDMIPHIAMHLLNHHNFSAHRYMVYAVRHWFLPEQIRKHKPGIYYYVGNIPYAAMDQHCIIEADADTIERIATQGGAA